MTKRFKAGLGAAALGLVFAFGGSIAHAKPADCFTKDDGHYPCDFRGTDSAGSFRATASGYPAVTLDVESAGVAWVFKELGGRNVALPGPYYRAEDDRACWENPDTDDRLCVW